ncbi:MAG: heme NO-binding domain-containing protein [Actinomycetota bacterium]
MYGLVNIAIRDLLVSAHGEETWDRIRERAGVTTTNFIAMERYADSVTYDLVGAASEELGTPADKLLGAFGEYWTRYTADKGYGDTLDFAGADLETFLTNLDAMHARVALSFPDLNPPGFDLDRTDDGRLLLHYHSDREGLAPMVEGLLHGLGQRFDKRLEIEHLPAGTDGEDHDRFLIDVHPA